MQSCSNFRMCQNQLKTLFSNICGCCWERIVQPVLSKSMQGDCRIRWNGLRNDWINQPMANEWAVLATVGIESWNCIPWVHYIDYQCPYVSHTVYGMSSFANSVHIRGGAPEQSKEQHASLFSWLDYAISIPDTLTVFIELAKMQLPILSHHLHVYQPRRGDQVITIALYDPALDRMWSSGLPGSSFIIGVWMMKCNSC